MSVFIPADILMPQVEEMEKWSVVACDQFTSQPEYWERVRETVGETPSAYHLILPEAELGSPKEESRIAGIWETMEQYLESGLFRTYQHAFVYVERTLVNGAIRKGLVGAVDLEAYDYTPGSGADVRATEQTVAVRIPPRMKIRRNAPLELPHVLLLCDDHEKGLIESIAEQKEQLPKLYDFDLMEEGGHISGWLVQGEAAELFERSLKAYSQNIDGKYADIQGKPMLFAVGDGNHSLASAKACYEEWKQNHPDEDHLNHPGRYALVELENIHDDALVFEPIHRVIVRTDAKGLLDGLKKDCCTEMGFPIQWYIGKKSGTIYLDRTKGELAVGILQEYLDAYLKEHAGEIDYIHGDDELKSLADQENAIGFLLPAMEKSQLFRGVIADGALPRKTFSMGHAQEKRYYLEARKIK